MAQKNVGCVMEEEIKKFIFDHWDYVYYLVFGVIVSGFLFEFIRRIVKVPKLLPEFKKNTVFLTSIPAPVETFTGRTNELMEIRDLLGDAHIALIVNGLGGIGKTALAKKFVADEGKRYDHIGWLVYSGSLKSTLVAGLAKNFDIESDNEDAAYIQILRALQNLNGKKLLVIDNYDEAHIEDSFADFPNNLKVLITSREKIDGIPEYPLDTLSFDDAKELFLKLAVGETDSGELDLLLDKLGCHSLMVEKIARTINKSPRLNTGKVLKIFEEKKLPDIKIQIDKKQTIFEYLSNLYSVDSLDSEELCVLQWFSVLPTVDFDYEQCLKMFGIEEEKYDDFTNHLNRLIDSGWLIRVGDKYRCHQIIREYILYHHAPTLEICLSVVDYYIDESMRLHHINPLSAVEILPFIENLLELFREEEDLRMANLANNLGCSYLALGEFKNAMLCQEKALKIREKILATEHPDLATSYNNISEIFRMMRDFNSAKHYQEKALKIREKILAPDHFELATSYNNLSLIYRAMKDSENALIYQKKAIKIKEKILELDHPSLADSYSNLSVVYRAMQDFEKAKLSEEKALNIKENTLKNEHPAFAQSYNNLGLIYVDLGNWNEGILYLKKAIILLEKLFPTGHPFLDTVRRNYQGVLRDMKKKDQ